MVHGISLLTTGKEIKVMTIILIFQSKRHHNQALAINSYTHYAYEEFNYINC